MSSWLVRIAAIAVGLFLIFLSVQSPGQSLECLAGATFFLGLAALSFWGSSEPHIFLAFAFVFAIHPVLGLLTGQVTELRRHGPRTVILATQPEAFWGNVAAYFFVVIVCLFAAAYYRRLRASQLSAQPHDED